MLKEPGKESSYVPEGGGLRRKLIDKRSCIVARAVYEIQPKAFPLHFCILQAMKNWGCRRPSYCSGVLLVEMSPSRPHSLAPAQLFVTCLSPVSEAAAQWQLVNRLYARDALRRMRVH